MAVYTKTYEQRYQENAMISGFDSYQVTENTLRICYNLWTFWTFQKNKFWPSLIDRHESCQRSCILFH